MLALSGLLVDEVAVGAGKLEFGVDGVDDSVVEGGFQLELHDGCLPDEVESVPQGFLGVEEGEEVLYEDVQLVGVAPLDIHPLCLLRLRIPLGFA